METFRVVTYYDCRGCYFGPGSGMFDDEVYDKYIEADSLKLAIQGVFIEELPELLHSEDAKSGLDEFHQVIKVKGQELARFDGEKLVDEIQWIYNLMLGEEKFAFVIPQDVYRWFDKEFGDLLEYSRGENSKIRLDPLGYHLLNADIKNVYEDERSLSQRDCTNEFLDDEFKKKWQSVIDDIDVEDK